VWPIRRFRVHHRHRHRLLLTLMPIAVAPSAPKWRRWFGVDIKRK
jgi:hypothetical protein